jgi:hypothetical protein
MHCPSFNVPDLLSIVQTAWFNSFSPLALLTCCYLCWNFLLSPLSHSSEAPDPLDPKGTPLLCIEVCTYVFVIGYIVYFVKIHQDIYL